MLWLLLCIQVVAEIKLLFCVCWLMIIWLPRKGRKVSIGSLGGVSVIQLLHYGCLHCIYQLNNGHKGALLTI